MIRTTPLLLLLAAALTATAAHAQRDPYAYKLYITPEDGETEPAIQRRYTRQLDACQKRAQITRENAECFAAEFRRQDVALNRTWRATLARLPTAKHQPLLVAQRKWIAARDPFCRRVYDSFGGGTIAPLAYSDCQAELTIRRTIWLENIR